MISTQLQRLELFEKLLKKRNEKLHLKLSIPEKIRTEKLRLLREHPEYEGKINSFTERDVFFTYRKDIIIYVEVGRIRG